jgi:alkyldihydroxyacetonephosphate synthase
MIRRGWKFWGWGLEGSGLEPAERQRLLRFYKDELGLDDVAPRAVPRVADIALQPPRLQPRDKLARFCTAEPFERIAHTYGKSFPEAVRVFAHDFDKAPDVVARPNSEAEVVALLDWASDARAAVIPFGGGSSVVGGVEPVVGDGFAGTISRASTRCSRSTAPAAPRASRPASSDRTSRRRSGPTA